MPEAELWREVGQFGKEAAYGSAAVATRKIYGMGLQLARPRASRPHEAATGRRDNVVSHTLGPVEGGGRITIPVSPDELPEWLACGIKGGVTPTTPSGATLARQWDFLPTDTLDSMTIERNDGSGTLRKAIGVYVNRYTFRGSVRGDNVCEMELFSKDYTALAALATSLAERVPHVTEGWEARLYLDAFGATPRTTLIPGTLINWEVSINNNLGRKFTADNYNGMKAATIGKIGITARLLFHAASAQAATEFANWDGETLRVAGLEWGQNDQIEASPTNEVQTVTITGSPTGGTFTLAFRGVTTAAIAYNATAATVLAALEALASINPGNVTVGGGPGPGTPYTVTFVNQLGGLDVAQMTAAHSFTGGSSPNIGVATTTPGVGYKKAVMLDIPGGWAAYDLNQEDEGSRAYELTLQYVYEPTALLAGLRARCITPKTALFAA